MLTRTCLAALDWNSNVGRAQRVSATGKLQYRIMVDRFGTRSVVPVKVEKSYQWQTDIFEKCVEGVKTGIIPQHQVQ